MPGPSIAETTEIQEIPKRTYQELTGEKQAVEGTTWSTDWLLSEYIRCTDGLIGKMDGTIPLKDKTVYIATTDGLKKEKRNLPPPTSVLYLDKSARPVEWLVRALWPILTRRPKTTYQEGDIPQKPRDFFLNIDKGYWLQTMKVPPHLLEDAPDELVRIELIDREQITRIRALFSTVEISEDNLEEAWNHPTIFDGQHVMIVDEVKSSGQTLNIAQMLLNSAIPEATFSGEYWAKPKRVALNKGREVDGKIQFRIEWVPVWYDPSNSQVTGRGIGDRDPLWPERAEKKGEKVSKQSKIGRFILSTPTHDLETYERLSDTKAESLRADIKQLAEDLASHRVLYRPSSDRPSMDDSDFESLVDRVETINNIDYKTWKIKRDQLSPTPL